LNQKLQAAAQPYGKTVGAYVLLTVIAEESDEAAFALRDYFIENSDRAALQEWSSNAGQDFSRVTYKDLAIQTFMAIPYVAGSYATVAAYLDGLVEAGIAGVCFIFPDYENDLQKLIDRVPPLRKYRGTARSAAAASASTFASASSTTL
jgi:pyrimidine oxygenase